MSLRWHLTVIAKQPVAGSVKTRLVPPLTYEQAAAIAAACLGDTFDAVAAFAREHHDVRPVALIAGVPGGWIPPEFEVWHQRGEGLGARLANGFADLGPGVIIGMDTPGAARYYGAAFDAVRSGRDALGPTHDGGYWGIGLAEPDSEVFTGVPMSTASTSADQLERLRSLGRQVEVLATVHDLDEFGDLAAVVAEAPGTRLAAAAASLVRPRWG